jgi:hypothetical protein
VTESDTETRKERWGGRGTSVDMWVSWEVWQLGTGAVGERDIGKKRREEW